LDGNIIDVHLVPTDEIEKQVQRAFEEFEAHLVICIFHGEGNIEAMRLGRVKFRRPSD
jgi:hypothetical protein